MGIRSFKPTSPARRKMTVLVNQELTKGAEPPKSLVSGKRRTGGRNSHGWETAWHMGGGHKRRYRIIDFKRNKEGIPAKVATIEYDPNRSARIALISYGDGDRRYILAPDGLSVGQKIATGKGADIVTGNCMPLKKVPLGMSVHNTEMQPGRGGQLCRSAGASATLTAREGRWAQITLPSGEVRRLCSDCRATCVSTATSRSTSWCRAGRGLDRARPQADRRSAGARS